MASDPIAEQSALALRLATEDPERAGAIAAEARDRAVEAGLAGAESIALRALGLAARSRNRIPEAIANLRAAVEAAERGERPTWPQKRGSAWPGRSSWRARARTP